MIDQLGPEDAASRRAGGQGSDPNGAPATLALSKPAGIPSPLAFVEPDTSLELPHQSWHEEWRPLLARFADATADMAEPQLVSYEPVPWRIRAKMAWHKFRTGRKVSGFTSTWHLPVNAIQDRGLRSEMLTFARAMYEYELPDTNAVILTGMLDGPHGDSVLALFAWLRAAIAEIAGQPSSGLAPPTAGTGSPDGSFEPHSDMWIPALLMNIFNDSVPGQGIPLMMPMEKLWPTAAEAGVPAEVIEQMKAAHVEAGECDYFEQFNGLLYLDHPWTENVKRALFAACDQAEMGPGQGYFVNDRYWLHGRSGLDKTALSDERRPHRLYRFVYNNARLDRLATDRRVEWKLSGRTASACKL